DQQGHTVLLHHGVVFVGLFVEGEPVLESRASAALHEDAQLQVRVALLGDQLAHLGGGGIGEHQGGGHLGDCIHWSTPFPRDSISDRVGAVAGQGLVAGRWPFGVPGGRPDDEPPYTQMRLFATSFNATWSPSSDLSEPSTMAPCCTC